MTKEFEYIETAEDKAAVKRIEKVWKAYSDALLWDLKDKFNDKYNADDCRTEDDVKDLVLSCVKRWLWEYIHDLGGDDAVVEQFCNDALTIAGRRLGGENFETYFDMKKFLDWKPKTQAQIRQELKDVESYMDHGAQHPEAFDRLRKKLLRDILRVQLRTFERADGELYEDEEL